jgi:hypothetical protein
MAGPVQVKRRGFLVVIAVFAAADFDKDEDDDASPDSSLAISVPLLADAVICIPIQWEDETMPEGIPAAVSGLITDRRTDRQVGGRAEMERKQAQGSRQRYEMNETVAETVASHEWICKSLQIGELDRFL